MSEESNAVLALQNAWTGAIAASDRLRELEPAIMGLAAESTLQQLDLDTYHDAALAQGNAAMALRGLVEELRRKRERDADGD